MIFIFLSPNEPDKYVAGQHGGESKGYAVSHEGCRLDLISLFFEDSDAGNICACTDRGEISAEGCAAEKSVVKKLRLHAHVGGDNGNNGEHRCRVGNIVDKRRENNGNPNDNRVNDELGAGAEFCDSVSDDVNNACTLDSADYDEKSGEKGNRVVVDLLEGVLDYLVILVEENLTDNADYEEAYADKAVGDIGLVELTLGCPVLVGNERSGDEKHDCSDEEKSREFILNLGSCVEFDFCIVLAEHKKNNECADDCSCLNDPEHTGFSAVNKEVREVEVSRFCEKNRSCVADERCRTLEIRGYRNAND